MLLRWGWGWGWGWGCFNDFKFGTFIDRFPRDAAANMAVKGLTSTETIRFMRDGGKRGRYGGVVKEVWRWGEGGMEVGGNEIRVAVTYM